MVIASVGVTCGPTLPAPCGCIPTATVAVQVSTPKPVLSGTTLPDKTPGSSTSARNVSSGGTTDSQGPKSPGRFSIATSAS